jgi:hypothetical protein
MDKATEEKQWALCPFCGSQKVPDERVIAKYVASGMPEADARQYVGEAQHGYYVCPTADDKHTRLAECLRMPFADGAYYHGYCRNARVARYVAATNRFVYMRRKFSSVFPESIGHAENDDGFDMFRAYGVLENPPFEIPEQVADITGVVFRKDG